MGDSNATHGASGEWNQLETHDDHTQLLIDDACEVLGYDPNNLTLRQKRRLADMLLGDDE